MNIENIELTNPKNKNIEIMKIVTEDYFNSLKLVVWKNPTKVTFELMFLIFGLFIAVLIQSAININNLSFGSLTEALNSFKHLGQNLKFFISFVFHDIILFFILWILWLLSLDKTREIIFREGLRSLFIKNSKINQKMFLTIVLMFLFAIGFGYFMQEIYLSFAEDNFKVSNNLLEQEMGKSENLISAYMFGIVIFLVSCKNIFKSKTELSISKKYIKEKYQLS